MLDREQLRAFAQRGFVVVPQVVPQELLATASRTIDELLGREPPPRDVRGPHFYFLEAATAPTLLALLTGSPAFTLAESLTGTGTLEVPWQVQVALTYPPFGHRPGGHHLDGATPPEPDGRPGTFTLLAGILLSDQPRDDMGNLWVWPGTHLSHQAFFREHGPDALMACGGYPTIPLPTPEQVHGRAGDLLLAHYLLGHNIGGNTSDTVRRTVYFRVKRVVMLLTGASSCRTPGWTTTWSAACWPELTACGNVQRARSSGYLALAGERPPGRGRSGPLT